MAKSSFGKLFLICASIGGAAGIIAGLGDRAEAATPPKPKSPVKKHRKVASAEGEQEENEAVVGGDSYEEDQSSGLHRLPTPAWVTEARKPGVQMPDADVKAAQKRQADYDAQSVAGQEKVVLDKTIKTSGLPLWTKLGWTKDGTRTLILVVPSFDHNMTMPDGTTKLQPKDALWRGAQLLAKKYKDVRAYDVAVQWSD